ncbi:hypothetical protein [Polyangium aurulentum]|uniref:hypothetical protein n=1 Tax=Polyangium aurulentum TaxID=2567896 RepID=UPI0011379620|nr:hypothetical protein [Polyangium aurulentum]UQA62872.1 hypothetical protein E8A73_021430 [Polyangium aurulentum]
MLELQREETTQEVTSDGEVRGIHYFVGDEQLRVFASLTPAQRLAWLEEMREFTALVAPPEAQRWWRRFRDGR